MVELDNPPPSSFKNQKYTINLQNETEPEVFNDPEVSKRTKNEKKWKARETFLRSRLRHPLPQQPDAVALYDDPQKELLELHERLRGPVEAEDAIDSYPGELDAPRGGYDSQPGSSRSFVRPTGTMGYIQYLKETQGNQDDTDSTLLKARKKLNPELLSRRRDSSRSFQYSEETRREEGGSFRRGEAREGSVSQQYLVEDEYVVQRHSSSDLYARREHTSTKMEDRKSSLNSALNKLQMVKQMTEVRSSLLLQPSMILPLGLYDSVISYLIMKIVFLL